MAPYALVGLQSLVLLFPFLWFYRRFGFCVGFSYILYFPVWANAHFDFHFDHLSIPLLLGFYWALLNRRIGWAALSATLLLFVKEVFCFQTVGCGVLLLCGFFNSRSIWEDSKKPVSQVWLGILGLWLIFIGLGYFYFVTSYVFPFFDFSSEGTKFTSNGPFAWLGGSLSEVLKNTIVSPNVIFADIFSTPGKLIYLFVIFFLLAFIPLLRPIFLIPALPLLMISMLSSLPNFYSLKSHYTAGLIIPVMISFAYGLPRAEKIWERILTRIRQSWKAMRNGDLTNTNSTIPLDSDDHSSLQKPSLTERGKELFRLLGIGFSTLQERKQVFYLMLFFWVFAGHISISPSPISRLFWSNEVWSYNWQAYFPTSRDQMIKEAIEKYIPPDYDVSVTAQNSLNLGYLAHRRVYSPFPLNATEPHKYMDWSNRTLGGFWKFVRTGERPLDIELNQHADYVVLDLKRPYFIIGEMCKTNQDKVNEFLELVTKTQSIYETVFKKDNFIIFRREKVNEAQL